MAKYRNRKSNVWSGGWATPTPPYITYPIQNVGWGKDSEPPPFWPTKLIPQDQIMLSPPAPAATPAPVPGPPLSPAEALIPPTGPIPVQDWFRLLRG